MTGGLNKRPLDWRDAVLVVLVMTGTATFVVAAWLSSMVSKWQRLVLALVCVGVWYSYEVLRRRWDI